MKREFMTLKGKVVIERDFLFIRTLIFRPGFTLLMKLFIPLAIVAMFFVIVVEEKNVPRGFFHIFLWGVFAMIQLPGLYTMLFKRSYSNRIPLDRIVSFEVKPDTTGLETTVILKLKNGRCRPIKFRTLEKQYEGFIELITQHVTQSQFA
jgi:hypothetical protein